MCALVDNDQFINIGLLCSSYIPASESVWQTCDGSGLQFPSLVHIAKIRKLTTSREASQLNTNDDPSSVEL